MQAQRFTSQASSYPLLAMLFCLLWASGCSMQTPGQMDLVNQTADTLHLCIGSTPWPQCVSYADVPPASIKVQPFFYKGEPWLFGLWVEYDSDFKSRLKDGVVIADARGRQRHIPLAEILKRRECMGTGSPCHYWRFRLDSNDLPP